MRRRGAPAGPFHADADVARAGPRHQPPTVGRLRHCDLGVPPACAPGAVEVRRCAPAPGTELGVALAQHRVAPHGGGGPIRRERDVDPPRRGIRSRKPRARRRSARGHDERVQLGGGAAAVPALPQHGDLPAGRRRQPQGTFAVLKRQGWAERAARAADRHQRRFLPRVVIHCDNSGAVAGRSDLRTAPVLKRPERRLPPSSGGPRLDDPATRRVAADRDRRRVRVHARGADRERERAGQQRGDEHLRPPCRPTQGHSPSCESR
jgi:hypothetical protein